MIAMGLSLSACTTINYVGIETYNPGEVTFPENVTKVLIVNNAVPQPEDMGYTYRLQGEKQDSCTARTDSAIFDACRSLGIAIVDASYFNDVLLYHAATRRDHQALSDKKLTQKQVAELCEENDVDAVISIDRLLFQMTRDERVLHEGFAIGMIDVKMSGVIRSYIPERETPLATVLIQDSLYWTESATYLSTVNRMLPTPDDALRTAGQYIGANAYINFVPHWVKETRWYYTGFSSSWKEASAYASMKNWDRAEEKWNQIYRSSKSWKSQAKAASNLALCYEINGDLEKAYEWAHKAYTLFEGKENEDEKTAHLLNLYVNALSERLRLDKKLNTQIGDN